MHGSSSLHPWNFQCDSYRQPLGMCSFYEHPPWFWCLDPTLAHTDSESIHGLPILSVCAFSDPHPLHPVLSILQHIGPLAESWWVDFWASVSVILLNLTLHWKAALLLFHLLKSSSFVQTLLNFTGQVWGLLPLFLICTSIIALVSFIPWFIIELFVLIVILFRERAKS